MGLDDYKQLTFSHRDHGVLLITINRPEKYNAADEELHSELARVWTDVAADPETRVAVITGAGQAFSAGGDLAMVERMAGDYNRVSHMLKEMSELVYNIINCDKPIVSAINGVAVGAGTVAALLADVAIVAEDARIGDGHVKLGVAAGDHAAIIWPLLAGMAKARYYLLTGEMITGAEAERIGMVAKALPKDQVLDEALRVADQLATGAQPAIRLTKRALNNWLRAAGPTFDQSAAYEMLTFMGPDVTEGVAALREKRAPSLPLGPGLTTLGWRHRAGNTGLTTQGWQHRAGNTGLATQGWQHRADDHGDKEGHHAPHTLPDRARRFPGRGAAVRREGDRPLHRAVGRGGHPAP